MSVSHINFYTYVCSYVSMINIRLWVYVCTYVYIYTCIHTYVIYIINFMQMLQLFILHHLRVHMLLKKDQTFYFIAQLKHALLLQFSGTKMGSHLQLWHHNQCKKFMYPGLLLLIVLCMSVKGQISLEIRHKKGNL